MGLRFGRLLFLAFLLSYSAFSQSPPQMCSQQNPYVAGSFTTLKDGNILDVVFYYENGSKRERLSNELAGAVIKDQTGVRYFQGKTNSSGFFSIEFDQTMDTRIFYFSCPTSDPIFCNNCINFIKDKVNALFGTVPQDIVSFCSSHNGAVLFYPESNLYFHKSNAIVSGPDLVVCIPLAFLISLLGASLYLSGRNPLAFFDFSAPRPKSFFTYRARSRGTFINMASAFLSPFRIANGVRSIVSGQALKQFKSSLGIGLGKDSDSSSSGHEDPTQVKTSGKTSGSGGLFFFTPISNTIRTIKGATRGNKTSEEVFSPVQVLRGLGNVEGPLTRARLIEMGSELSQSVTGFASAVLALFTLNPVFRRLVSGGGYGILGTLDAMLESFGLPPFYMLLREAGKETSVDDLKEKLLHISGKAVVERDGKKYVLSLLIKDGKATLEFHTEDGKDVDKETLGALSNEYSIGSQAFLELFYDQVFDSNAFGKGIIVFSQGELFFVGNDGKAVSLNSNTDLRVEANQFVFRMLSYPIASLPVASGIPNIDELGKEFSSAIREEHQNVKKAVESWALEKLHRLEQITGIDIDDKSFLEDVNKRFSESIQHANLAASLTSETVSNFGAVAAIAYQSVSSAFSSAIENQASNALDKFVDEKSSEFEYLLSSWNKPGQSRREFIDSVSKRLSSDEGRVISKEDSDHLVNLLDESLSDGNLSSDEIDKLKKAYSEAITHNITGSEPQTSALLRLSELSNLALLGDSAEQLSKHQEEILKALSTEMKDETLGKIKSDGLLSHMDPVVLEDAVKDGKLTIKEIAESLGLDPKKVEGSFSIDVNKDSSRIAKYRRISRAYSAYLAGAGTFNSPGYVQGAFTLSSKELSGEDGAVKLAPFIFQQLSKLSHQFEFLTGHEEKPLSSKESKRNLADARNYHRAVNDFIADITHLNKKMGRDFTTKLSRSLIGSEPDIIRSSSYLRSLISTNDVDFNYAFDVLTGNKKLTKALVDSSLIPVREQKDWIEALRKLSETQHSDVVLDNLPYIQRVLLFSSLGSSHLPESFQDLLKKRQQLIEARKKGDDDAFKKASVEFSNAVRKAFESIKHEKPDGR